MTKRRSPTRRTATGRSLKAAEGLFACLCSDLDRERARLSAALEAGDADCPRVIADLARQTQKALQTVLELQVRLGRETEAAGNVAQGTLDLEAARDEIESRLARLVACDQAGAASDGAFPECARCIALVVERLGASVPSDGSAR